MSKYSFNVSKLDLKFSRRYSLRRKTTKINTEINVENSRLKIVTTRVSEKFDRKYNSFSEGESEILIDDISSIKYRIGYAIALNFHQIFLIMNILLGFFGLTMWFNELSIDAIYGEMNSLQEINILLPMVYLFGIGLLISNITFKCIQINFRNSDTISYGINNKIVIPVSNNFFFPMDKENKKRVNSLLEEIQKINPNTRYKKDKLHIITVIVLIILMLTNIIGTIIEREEYLSENDLSYNLQNNKVYTDVAFEKAMLTNIEKKEKMGKQVYVCVYTIKGTGQEIRIENQYGKQVGKTYNMYIINYYKKENNSLFTTEYKVSEDNSVGQFSLCCIKYYYDYNSGRKFCFNILNDRGIAQWETEIYYNNCEIENTLYNFIHSTNNIIPITNDFDLKNTKTHKYTYLEKLTNYESEYGTCYVLKAEKNNKTDYLMYIENKNKIKDNEFDGILINTCIDMYENFKDDNSAVKSFKRILCEI